MAIPKPELKRWANTIIFDLIFLIVWFVYNSITRNSFDIYSFNRALADNAVFIICLSFILSGISYFWKIGNSKLIYRMNLGVSGFFMAWAHEVFALFFYFFDQNSPKPQFQFDHSWQVFGIIIPNIVAFGLGVVALTIFGAMALISLKYFVLRLGGLRWRKLLRYGGYSSITIVSFHFMIKNFSHWTDSSTWNVLPPLSLLLWLMIISTLILRLALWLSVSNKERQTITAPSAPAS